MQYGLGVATGLLKPLEDQIACCFISGGGCEVVGHVFIERVTGILSVHDLGHALEGGAHLGFSDNAVQQPVGNVLARDTQGGAVLHEADVMNIWHL